MTNLTPNELVEQIQSDMRQAMKSRRRAELDELRSLMARISNAEAISPDGLSVDDVTSSIAGAARGVGSTEAQRRVLSTDDIRAIIRAEQQEIQETLSQIDDSTEYAAELQAKAAVVSRILDL